MSNRAAVAIVVAVVLVLQSSVALAQLDTAWVRSLDASCRSMALDADGNIIVAGQKNDFWVAKYSSDGVLVWERTYVSDPDCGGYPGFCLGSARAIAIDAQGSVFATGWSGHSQPEPFTNKDVVTIKYAANGTQLWVDQYEGAATLWDEGWDIVLDAGGNAYVTGICDQSIGPDYWVAEDGDAVTLKYDPSGTRLWVRTYDGPSSRRDNGVAVALDQSSNVYVTGICEGWTNELEFDSSKCLTLSYTNDGVLRWLDLYDSALAPVSLGMDLIVDASDNVYVTGGATIRYNPASGTRIWARYLNTTNASTQPDGFCIAEAPQGNFAVAGSAVALYTADGDTIWRRDPVEISYIPALALDPSGDVFVGGRGGPNLLASYGPTGNPKWEYSYQDACTEGQCSIEALTVTEAGTLFVADDISGTSRLVKYFQQPPVSFCCSFDGVDDFIEVPHHNSFNWSQQATIECWMRVDGTGSGVIFNKWKSNLEDKQLVLDSRRKITFHLHGLEPAGTNRWSRSALNIDQWQHVTGTTDGDSLYIYIDGIYDTAWAASGSAIGNSSDPARIGAPINRPDSGPIPGQIEELRIWNVYKSPQDIQAMMFQEASGNEPGLVAVWHFNEGQGQTAYDLSPNQNDGRLGSGAGQDEQDPQWVVTTSSTVTPVISLNPTSLSFGAIQSGSLPPPQTFAIANTGGGVLDWSVTTDQTWLDPNPLTGSNNYEVITVSVNTTDLMPATYDATITVASPNAENPDQTVSVEYNVSSPNEATVAGRVTDCGSGAGLAGAAVEWGAYATTTIANGDYDLGFVACGTNTLTISKSGYQSYSENYTPVCMSSNEKNACLWGVTCVVITNSLTVCADNVIEDPPQVYTLNGNVAINGILGLEGTVIVDKRGHLAYPEITGDGAITAQNIQGSDYNLYAGGGSYTWYAEDDNLKAHDASGLLRGDFTVFGFVVNLGNLGVDPGGTFVETEYTIDLVYPFDAVMEGLASENDFPAYFDQASFGRTYSRSGGIATHGDIGPLGVNFGLWELYDLNVYWDEIQGILGGGFKVKIPGRVGSSPGRGAITALDLQDPQAASLTAIPVEIHDESGRLVGVTDFGQFMATVATGAFLDGFGVEIEFVPGGLNKLIVYLTGSIPLGSTGLRITEMGGGLEDIQTNIKVVATVDIETLLPELPVIGPPIKVDDLGITARPFSYLRGEGTLAVCSYDLTGASVEYDGSSGHNSLSVKGYLNLADIFTGNVKTSLSGSRFQGSGKVTLKTPDDLPWVLGWAENQVISQSDLSIDNADFKAQGQLWKLSLAARMLFGKETFPWYHFYLGKNYDNLHKIWKATKVNQQLIEFQVPVNCPQIFVVAGNDAYLFDYQVESPGGQMYNSTDPNYRQFGSTYQTVLAIDYPEPGPWRFETAETGSIQMEALGANPPPTIKAALPATKRSSNPTISLSFGDYADTVNVEIYWDNDNGGGDGELIAGFNVENNASVDFVWNTTNLPPGEYFIYTKADDGYNAPILQYAPGSIWVDNNSALGIPQNVTVTRDGDSLGVSWDAPTAPEVAGAIVYLQRVSDRRTTSYATDSNVGLFLYDVTPEFKYEIWTAFIDSLGNTGPGSASVLVDFENESQNNAPFLTLDLDSSWYFVVGESKQYGLAALDFDDDPIVFSGVGLPNGATVQGSQFTWLPDDDSLAGYHAFMLVASDDAGDADTLPWGAVVYKPEELEIRVHFSQTNLYEGDNMYVIISNAFDIEPQASVTVENLTNAQSAPVICDRTSHFKYTGTIALSSASKSLLPVTHGDSLKATYAYGGDVYTAFSRFDSTSQPGDVTPPRTVVDLQLHHLYGDSVFLYWTAPGDDSTTGRALYYDLRYSYSPILTEDDYLVASKFTDVPYPEPPDQSDSVLILTSTLEGHVPGAELHFVLKAEDEMMNRSGMSNELTVLTCACPNQSDFDADGFLTALDLGWMIDVLFAGDPDIQDSDCPGPRADFDCDGFSTALDLSGLIDHLFAGGGGPCDPCVP